MRFPVAVILVLALLASCRTYQVQDQAVEAAVYESAEADPD